MRLSTFCGLRRDQEQLRLVISKSWWPLALWTCELVLPTYKYGPQGGADWTFKADQTSIILLGLQNVGCVLRNFDIFL